jgi:hypothetical protein
MKKYGLLMVCFWLLLAGCVKDDGFRAVTIEIEMDAIAPSVNGEESWAEVFIWLKSTDPDVELWKRLSTGNGRPKVVFQSDEMAWAVGTNVLRSFEIRGETEDESDKLPCNVKVRVKSDNKIVWSHDGKAGDPDFWSEENLIIR